MSVIIYVEGGGSSNDLQRRCRQAFSTLLRNCGLEEAKFRIVACGPRNQTFNRFKLKVDNSPRGSYVAMWIDSEDPVVDIEKTWDHLAVRDPSWIKPDGATDEYVLFMTTCMETLIAADRATLEEHYGSILKKNKLPPLAAIERRDRKAILKTLEEASEGRYEKGDISFQILAKLNPDTLQLHLPSFKRTRRILKEKLEFQ